MRLCTYCEFNERAPKRRICGPCHSYRSKYGRLPDADTLAKRLRRESGYNSQARWLDAGEWVDSVSVETVSYDPYVMSEMW